MIGGASSMEQVCIAFAGGVDNAEEVAQLYGMDTVAAGNGAQVLLNATVRLYCLQNIFFG